MSYPKLKFLVIGPLGAAGYKNVWKYIKCNRLWLGYKKPSKFIMDGIIRKFGNICWFTNLKVSYRNDYLVLTEKYDAIKYPKYENYDAIEVNEIKNIPYDYKGIMGVSASIIEKYNPKQFKILGQTHSGDNSPEVEALRTDPKNRHRGIINGRHKYQRILIKNLMKEK